MILGGKVWSVRLGGMISTLLGPEGTTGPVRRRLHCGGDGLLFQNYPGMASGDIPAVDDSAGVVRMGLWVGCWLRIAQWTRASCFL